jgi:hypothetical protein
MAMWLKDLCDFLIDLRKLRNPLEFSANALACAPHQRPAIDDRAVATVK